MKKILIIGAGFLQSFVIKKAKELGYYTIAIDKNQYSLGFQYADEYGIVDIVDQKACLEYAISKGIDGVITAATDYGVLSTAYIARKMRLPGLNYEVAKVIKDKYKIRNMLFENKVDDVSQYYEVYNKDFVDNLKDNIKFPVMVKPSDGSGSKAAKRVDSFVEMKDACNEAIRTSLVGKALIEDFIEGEEFGVESFVYKGEVHILGVLGKKMTSPPDYAELGHYMPSRLDSEMKIKEVVRNAIRSLNINFGAVNMDVLVTEDNRVCIVDVGARMGGNLIGSHIIPKSTGIDYMRILIRAAVGDEVDLKAHNNGGCIVTRLLALKPGKIKSLPDFEKIKEEYKVDIYHDLKVGREIREYHNNIDGCGYVVSMLDDIKDAASRAEKAKRSIDLGIIRE
ncbi:ATP-grasp domain-containing protein [Evansella clarkii]|uniref:ATP-grasp domain-containing protein n=1 Tax=Evansella clarkii TaxID=79879 RepID=UPI0009968C75|nr:ATP-grasp domain-containing protein [Evansella clarkii]